MDSMKVFNQQIKAKPSSGMTLIELLLVMLMISFVLAVAYTIYFLGAKSFTSSNNRSDAQYECRQAVNFITGQARIAGKYKVEFLSAYPNTAGDTNDYIFIDKNNLLGDVALNDNLLIYKHGTVDPVVKAGINQQVNFTQLSFSSPAAGVLRITAETTAGTGVNRQTHLINSDIKLLNYPDFPSGQSGIVLKITP